jgi:2-polyprenyl-3-methyl-5-hydroxy-6-metoxy-1,4-benzoquinol methylase
MLRIEPFIEEQAAEALHTHDYFDRSMYAGTYCQTHGGSLHPPIWDDVLTRLLHYRNAGDLLDVGCAHGFFLQAAARRGFRGYGVELVPSAAEHAQQLGFTVHNGTLRSKKFRSGSFDVVTLLDVLEHFANPLAELQEVRRVLRPGGVVVILTPNAKQASIVGERWRGFRESFEHLLFFDPKTLRHLLKSTSFDVLDIFSRQPNLSLSTIRRAGAALRVDHAAVSSETRPSLWKTAARGGWSAANRLMWFVPEQFLVGHMLIAIAQVSGVANRHEAVHGTSA